MDWKDIACIVFACTAANHLGLVAAVERVISRPIPVVNCPKCLTCWSVMAYCMATVPCTSAQDVLAVLPRLLAISLLCSYLAIWLELLMYAIDTLYNRIYVRIENISQEGRDEDSSEGE